MSEKKIRDLAREVGLDMARLETEMNSKEIRDLIKADMENGRQVGLRGTPTLFINGKLVQDRTLETIQVMIDAELNKTKEGGVNVSSSHARKIR